MEEDKKVKLERLFGDSNSSVANYAFAVVNSFNIDGFNRY
jgi:hypothetical protein